MVKKSYNFFKSNIIPSKNANNDNLYNYILLKYHIHYLLKLEKNLY